MELQYPRSGRLFRCLLASNGLTLGELVEKATQIVDATGFQEISQIFTDISKALPAFGIKKATQTVKPLLHKEVFPVITPRGAKFRQNSLMSLNNQSWFIADRTHLRQAFWGIVGLLSFTPQELEPMEELIKVLGLESRKLSLIVESQNRPQGRLSFNVSHTMHFQKRAPFIQGYV